MVVCESLQRGLGSHFIIAFNQRRSEITIVSGNKSWGISIMINDNEFVEKRKCWAKIGRRGEASLYK